jgi:hypothetical protein
LKLSGKIAFCPLDHLLSLKIEKPESKAFTASDSGFSVPIRPTKYPVSL